MNWDERSERLMRDAVSREAPENLVQRLQERRAEFFSSKRTSSRPRRWKSWLWSVGAAIAASVALMIWAGLNARPSLAQEFKQISKALGKQQWIHVKTTEASPMPFAFWQDSAGNVVAFSGEEGFVFVDKRTGRRRQYDSALNVVYDLPTFATDETPRHLSSLISQLVTSLLEGQTQLVIGDQTVAFDRRPELRDWDGKKWVEAVLDLDDARWVLLFDPKTRLPGRWLASRTDQPDRGQELVFDYPKSGPKDVFSLPGVAADAPVVVRDYPQMVDELRTNIDKAADALQPHLAVVVQSVDGVPGDKITLVWRTPTKTRTEERHAMNPEQKLLLERGSRSFAEWVEQIRKLPLTWLTVFDETEAFYSKVDPETGNFIKPSRAHSVMRNGVLVTGGVLHPETAARPGLTMFLEKHARHFDASIQTLTEADAPAPILLEFRHTKPDSNSNNAWDFHRYWIDPTRGYLALRTEQGMIHDGKDDVISKSVVTDLAQSPQGNWYPVKLEKTYKGKTRTYQFFVSFEASIDEALFAMP